MNILSRSPSLLHVVWLIPMLALFFIRNNSHVLSMFFHTDQRSTIPDDIYRTAVVMPCMVSDLFVLPFALKSLHESNDTAHETLIVFSFKTDLEEELAKVFPLEGGDEVEAMRDQYRSFFLKYVKHLPDTEGIIGNSIRINKKTPYLRNKKLSLEDLARIFRIDTKDNHLDINIRLLIEEHPSYDALMDLPNLSIIVNQDEEPYCNASRFRGGWEAFGGPPHDHARMNDIVQYIDCDDLVSPVRQRFIEETFRETPEAMEILGGYVTNNLSNLPVVLQVGFKGEEIYPDDESLGIFFKPTPLNEWTHEFVEDHLMAPFAIRDQAKVENIFSRQGPQHQRQDAMDPLADNINGQPGTWAWFVQKGQIDPGVPPMEHWKGSPFAIQNGHPSFRHAFIVKDLLAHSTTGNAFPNFRYGSDSRLNYHVMHHGYKVLGLPYPLTHYTLPQGDQKRNLIKGICHDEKCASGNPKVRLDLQSLVKEAAVKKAAAAEAAAELERVAAEEEAAAYRASVVIEKKSIEERDAAENQAEEKAVEVGAENQAEEKAVEVGASVGGDRPSI